MFTASLFTITKIWKQLKCPSTEKLMKKMNEILSLFMSTSNNMSCETWLEYEIGKGKYHRSTWEQGNPGHFRGKKVKILRG